MTADLTLRPVTVFVDPDCRPSGETPIPPPAEPMGRVLPFPGTPAPQAEKPATPDRKTRKAPKAKPRKWALKDFILAHPRLNASAKLIGAKACELFDLKAEYAFASNAWFEQGTHKSASTIRRAFVDLESEGIMRREINAAWNGQNKIHPNWNAIGGQSEPALDDHGGQSSMTTGGNHPCTPPAVILDRGRQSKVTAVGGAEVKQEEKHEGGVEDVPQALPRTRGPACFPERKTNGPSKASLPVDWRPDDGTRQHGVDKLGTEAFESMLGRFVNNYAVEKTETRLVDWNARLRQWVDKDATEAGRRPRGTTMPDGWEPSEETIKAAVAYVKAKRLPSSFPLRQTSDAFVQHHTTGKGCSFRVVDWNSVWLAEMKTAVDRETKTSPKRTAV